MDDGIRRRTSGFGYWRVAPLAMPFVPFLIYGIAAWLAFQGLSDALGKARRMVSRKGE